MLLPSRDYAFSTNWGMFLAIWDQIYDIFSLITISLLLMGVLFVEFCLHQTAWVLERK